ncbi:hypothetical protein Q4603_17540 [Zobellia galactanivorans]|uniref:Uncharacterized protein n=1 Tax=Zobellia galactanivorans (strain DSM 12802 / CCUG 47099 / CIP 106680 / NCIMB 13871 / Dsij) TaxID=63186 RepID=G0L2S2_ZOBGA|nr:hypothetical protein [Zobellia galactanivorans]MBU3028357.1 hypothetical protein [Zobellia galactanivorans]MDO6810430.1 hypothetical protein [Zobellia galactanivorans]CAZ95158.1 Putative protein [Zobellia galactanivorans]
MEVNYKIYRKVKIYFNKVCAAIPHLEQLQERSSLAFGASLVQSRIEEMRLVQAELVSFFMNPSLKVPFVPASRCLALMNWYSDNALFSCASLAAYSEMLVTEDHKVIQDANYILSDRLLPSRLKVIFENHRSRLQGIQTSSDVLNKD